MLTDLRSRGNFNKKNLTQLKQNCYLVKRKNLARLLMERFSVINYFNFKF